ncbi:MAG: hypothetical protein GY806_05460, partial [Gammaproteobacteria bacterium]|nr:hypothetical protein [Gammaproteobacteria bacterium]
IVLGLPIRGIAQNTDTGVGGSWVGVYLAHPDLFQVEIEITQNSKAAGGLLTGALINYPTSLIRSTQRTTPYKYSITGKHDPKTGYIELQVEKLLEPEGGRRTVYPFYGIYDRNTDSLVGFLDTGRSGHGIDLPIYCVRASQKETLSDFIRQITGVNETEAEEQHIEEKKVLAEQHYIAQEGTRRRTDAKAQVATRRNDTYRIQRQIENLKSQIESQKNIIRNADWRIDKGGNYVASAKKKKDRAKKKIGKAETKLKKCEAELADINASSMPAQVSPTGTEGNSNKNQQRPRDLERILRMEDLQRRYRGVKAFILKLESDLPRKNDRS